MASIPYSILLCQKEHVLPMSTIQEHQKFCKKFLKAHQTFEKYKNNSNSKLAFINDNVFLFNQKKQSQTDILTWFDSLSEEEKLSLFSIKNKWLVNIFTQMFFIHYKMGNYSYKPLSDMCFCFEDQKKYLSRDQKSNSLNSLYELLESKNISFKQGIGEESTNNDNEENEYIYDELNFISNFFETKEIIDSNYLKSEKREYEIKLIENIKVICSEKDIFDTITFKKDFIMNVDTIRKFFDFFANENYFRDWVIPINAKNVYNFVLPYWMHNAKDLSLCQLIMGFFEQKIMVNYEYYYYTKKIYEFSLNKQISELYNENQKLEKFIKNNYSINANNNKNKEEILTLKKISQVVDDLRGDIKFNKKIKLIKDIFNKICEEKPCYRGKEIVFNDELSLEVYNSLNKELKKESNNYIPKLVDSVSFISFLDIISLRQDIYNGFRKIIIDSQCNLVLDELNSEGFLHKKSNKKHNKKKKKKDNLNNNKNNDGEKKVTPQPIKINIYDVQTKEIECEYNMNSRSHQCNMIQENASNVIINSYNNNNNIFIRGNKKSEDKKPQKVEIVKKTEEKLEKKEEKKEDKKEENKEVKKEDKKEEKKEIKKEEKIEEKKEEKREEKNEIKKEKEKEEDNKEEEKEKKTKEKHKNKEFFLYPINKKKKKENTKDNNNNINKINEIKVTNETKEKPKNNNKNKKQKSTKEDIKEVPNKNNKNYKKYNFVQERKNNVQINPCPRRKKKVSFQTSSINFEMHMKPSFDSYPYYYSFPMMKPFTSLSEVSTKFSMPSTKSNPSNNETKTNKNSIDNKIQKSHWDYSQYNNNYNNLQLFNSFIPSEKYFDSLNKELDNYLSVTNSNMRSLKTLYDEKLNLIENLIKNGLSENYEIKFGHYGSFFTNVSIEGSDLDILVYYHKRKEESEFYKDILNLLEQNENKFQNICPILTASVPVIKLQIDIKDEILEKEIKLKNASYFEEEDLSKIKIDLTFTENEEEFQHSNEVVTYINKSLEEYPLIKPILLLLKRYFKDMNMNKAYTGGLCSYSLFLLVLSFCKCNKQCESATKLLYYFMENFTYFDYCNYCIDVEKENCYILKDKNENEKSVSDGNSSYDTNYELYENEIYIVDPISKLNVSKSSFKVDEIILTFRKAFNLLYYEGWYYDLNPKDKNKEKTIVDNMNELYEDDSSDFKTIKKLFDLNTLNNNFDFYFN